MSLKPARPRLHLETAGVPKAPVELLAQFELVVISPKLRNAGQKAHNRMTSHQYAAMADLDNTWFKFVVTGREDLDEVSRYQATLGLTRVMVMAEGPTETAHCRLPLT